MKEYDYDYNIELKNINEQIIKPEGFVIPNESIKIHGITNELAIQKGKSLIKSLKKIEKRIEECEYIIGYNIYYDINVLLSELYRKNRNDTINKILKMKEEKKIICLGQISSKEAIPDIWKKKFKYQIPKQTEVYKKCFGEELKNAHNAKSDVLGMIQIMEWIYENNNKLNIVGKL
jgi:DNA polymerase III epsilon subunit-like protein